MRTSGAVVATLAVACATGSLAFAPAGPRTATPTVRSSKLILQQSTGTGKSLEYDPDKYKDPNAGNYRRLSDSLANADVEAKKAAEEMDKRERAAEIRRDERLAKINFMKEMDDELEVGTVEDFMFKEGVRDILDRLDSDLVGLIPVKKRVREIAALLVLDKMRGKLGFDTAVPSLHMCFTGAPGTGKTTVALRMGQILARMGYCRLGHVVVATRDDLVGQYVGHTAPKTKDMIKKAFGGILLVDEAYYLYNASNDKDYGQESIEILLNVMENQKEDLIVTLAGYKDRMDRFFSFIPGMSSRIGNHIDFPNYEKDELVEIAQVMARDLQYAMDDSAAAKFQEYIDLRMQFPFFSNARTVRNAMDRARMNSAIRVFNEAVVASSGDGMVSAMDLATITESDFQILLDELVHYQSIGKMDAIVA
ncbi:cbbx protein [Tribonema minus]|uniref:Cbbx protein n=1 Tax=Tribonema minus TaxID=303371 RepID=A0A835YTH7_9STRA|nr:cbbx protein [Tribonema minus]